MTRNANILKLILLLVSFAILAVILNVLYDQKPQTNNNEKQYDISAKNLQDYKFNISQSMFEGLSKDQLPYKITAQNLQKIDEDLYEINVINAQYSLSKGVINIKAAGGTLDEKQNLVSLKKDVNMEFNGINCHTDEILLDLKSNDVVSNVDILLRYQNSTIKSDRFNTKDSAKRINFEGNVKSVFKLKDFE